MALNRYDIPDELVPQQTYVSQYVPLPIELYKSRLDNTQKKADDNLRSSGEAFGKLYASLASMPYDDPLRNKLLEDYSARYKELIDEYDPASRDFTKKWQTGVQDFVKDPMVQKIIRNKQQYEAEETLRADLEAKGLLSQTHKQELDYHRKMYQADVEKYQRGERDSAPDYKMYGLSAMLDYVSVYDKAGSGVAIDGTSFDSLFNAGNKITTDASGNYTIHTNQKDIFVSKTKLESSMKTAAESILYDAAVQSRLTREFGSNFDLSDPANKTKALNLVSGEMIALHTKQIFNRNEKGGSYQDIPEHIKNGGAGSSAAFSPSRSFINQTGEVVKNVYAGLGVDDKGEVMEYVGDKYVKPSTFYFDTKGGTKVAKGGNVVSQDKRGHFTIIKDGKYLTGEEFNKLSANIRREFSMPIPEIEKKYGVKIASSNNVEANVKNKFTTSPDFAVYMKQMGYTTPSGEMDPSKIDDAYKQFKRVVDSDYLGKTYKEYKSINSNVNISNDVLNSFENAPLTVLNPTEEFSKNKMGGDFSNMNDLRKHLEEAYDVNTVNLKSKSVGGFMLANPSSDRNKAGSLSFDLVFEVGSGDKKKEVSLKVAGGGNVEDFTEVFDASRVAERVNLNPLPTSVTHDFTYYTVTPNPDPTKPPTYGKNTYKVNTRKVYYQGGGEQGVDFTAIPINKPEVVNGFKNLLSAGDYIDPAKLPTKAKEGLSDNYLYLTPQGVFKLQVELNREQLHNKGLIQHETKTIEDPN